jgi:hypothetical protein
MQKGFLCSMEQQDVIELLWYIHELIYDNCEPNMRNR